MGASTIIVIYYTIIQIIFTIIINLTLTIKTIINQILLQSSLPSTYFQGNPKNLILNIGKYY